MAATLCASLGVNSPLATACSTAPIAFAASAAVCTGGKLNDTAASLRGSAGAGLPATVVRRVPGAAGGGTAIRGRDYAARIVALLSSRLAHTSGAIDDGRTSGCKRGIMDIRKIAAAGIMLVALAGCAGAAIEGANIVRDKAIVANNIDAARAGNAVAQYKVGEALCCSLNEGAGFYNTPQSVDWLCQAAAQGHPGSAFKLGQIYSGETVDGVRLIRRVGAAIAGASTDIPVAYSWFRHAETGGIKDATKISDKMWREMTPAERDTAAAMLTGKAPLRCRWNEVIRQD